MEATLQAYADMTRQELYGLAQERELEGRSRLSKDELVAALELDDLGPDAVALLLEQHDEIRHRFSVFGELSPRPSKKKEKLVGDIITYLMRHARIEEQVFYPAVRKALPDLGREVDEDLEEHHVAELLLSELDAMTPSTPRYDAKVTVLMETVTHHLEEEEEQLFPRVREELTERRRREIGAALQNAWAAAPTRPNVRVTIGEVDDHDHPAPDSGTIVSGAPDSGAPDRPTSEPPAEPAATAELAATVALDDAASSDTAGGTDDAGDDGTDDAGDAGDDGTDDAMTRSEQELLVGTETREAGTARLRKQVVTEHVTETVPVQREEPVVRREPITAPAGEDALEGPPLSEDELEVTLYGEEPVVEKRTVPKERVRLQKEIRTDHEQVTGDLDREDIEVEIAGEPTEADVDDREIDLVGLEESRQAQDDR